VKTSRIMVKKLQEKGIVVSARMNGVRVSPHFYNTEEELERLIEELESFKSTMPFSTVLSCVK